MMYLLLRDRNNHWTGHNLADNQDSRGHIIKHYTQQIESNEGDYTGILFGSFRDWGKADNLMRKMNTIHTGLHITPYQELTPEDQARAREHPGIAYEQTD